MKMHVLGSYPRSWPSLWPARSRIRRARLSTGSTRIVIPGTVVSSDSGNLILRTDDHGHRMAFVVGPGDLRGRARLRKGAHVSVTYHPLGPTGQAADDVQVIERGADARSQASFKVVTGPGDTRVTAR